MLPSGTVTFLFSDIVGSTARWEANQEAMRLALEEHNSILNRCFTEWNGHVFKTVGDAFCVAFQSADAAAAAAIEAQNMLEKAGDPLTVRMGLHTGSIEPTGADYFGPVVNKVARVQAAAQPGQIVASDATRGLLSAKVPTKDLGTHSLKDLQEPVRLWQVGEGEFAALVSLATVPNNLPIQTTSFVGREEELLQISELATKSRLITLTGTGGTGKSRLSLQIASENLDQYPGGVWFCELAPLSGREQVIPEVVRTIKVPDGSKNDLDRLLEFLGPLQCLVILDNCEHVLDAASELAEAIIGTCPKTAVLTTSREPLGARGEATYRVPSLEVPKASENHSLEDLTHFGATALFLDRLTLAASEQILPENAAAIIANICTRLDGIPLAIELAAARGRSMPLETIEKRLSDRFRLLTGGSRNALSRQQTLRAMIDWSAKLLTEQQLNFFISLAVFAGGWDLESAERVCVSEELGIEEWDVLEILSALVDKSLVQLDSTAGRYRLLESMRLYCQEQLENAPWAIDLRNAHGRYFLTLAEDFVDRSETAKKGSGRRLGVNYENFHKGVEWLTASNLDIELVLSRLIAAEAFFHRSVRINEYLELLEPLLERSEGVVDPILLAQAEGERLQLLVIRRAPNAERLLEEAIEKYPKLPDEQKDGWIVAIGYSLFYREEFEHAIEFLKGQVALGAPFEGRAQCHLVLGNSYTCLRDYAKSIHHFDLAARIGTEKRNYVRALLYKGSAITPVMLLNNFREGLSKWLDCSLFQKEHQLQAGIGFLPFCRSVSVQSRWAYHGWQRYFMMSSEVATGYAPSISTRSISLRVTSCGKASLRRSTLNSSMRRRMYCN